MAIAVLGQWDAPHELHHEVGPARFGGAGVQRLRDVGMVHDGQRLPLGLEAGQDVPRVHPELDDLERDGATEGLELLGFVHDAHATLAQHADHAVRADAVGCCCRRRERRHCLEEARIGRGGA